MQHAVQPGLQKAGDAPGLAVEVFCQQGVRDYLDEIRQDYVVLMEGDLVANLPMADIFAHHLRTHA